MYGFRVYDHGFYGGDIRHFENQFYSLSEIAPLSLKSGFHRYHLSPATLDYNIWQVQHERIIVRTER